MLERAFRAEHLKPDPDLYPYLIARLPRSAAEALAAAALLDEAALAQHRAVNKALAREVLGDLEGEED